MAEQNFVDYVKINCRSGSGGQGSAHLHRDKLTSKEALMEEMVGEVHTL